MVKCKGVQYDFNFMIRHNHRHSKTNLDRITRGAMPSFIIEVPPISLFAKRFKNDCTLVAITS